MKIKVLFFGITAELVGNSQIDFKCKENATVVNFKQQLLQEYPQLKSINTYAIAVNEAYASDDEIIKNDDIIAIIPPVSGG